MIAPNLFRTFTTIIKVMRIEVNRRDVRDLSSISIYNSEYSLKRLQFASFVAYICVHKILIIARNYYRVECEMNLSAIE